MRRCAPHPRRLLVCVVGVVLVSVTAAVGGNPAAAADVCTSSLRPDLAARMSQDIRAALAGRSSTTAIAIDHPRTGLACRLRADQQFDSASVVKVTILGALLRQAQEQQRGLTAQEQQQATVMITNSDNDAATALWNKVGRAGISHFLQLAGMSRTVPGPGNGWGLTQITANDQLRLLSLLTGPNSVLTSRSRAYVLDLMSRVVPDQRWGTPAGAPAGVAAKVKNGWRPGSPHGWRVHSIGTFSGRDAYTIVVLTHDNPSMPYGIGTIENVARAIHRDLGAGGPRRS